METPPEVAPPRTSWFVAFYVVMAMLGAVAGLYLFEPDTWGVARRLLAGALMGVVCAVVLTANRLIAR